MAATTSLHGNAPATFVYVSNADDGSIAMYRLHDSGALASLGRVEAAGTVMPMTVSPDRRFLYAATRTKPYTAQVYAIDAGSGALVPLATAPLVESFPYISIDRSGRFLFGASYSAHLISVNAVAPDGGVAAEPLQVIPVGRHAHSIRVDETNRFVYVPTLGSDQVFQLTFDATSGRLASNTPAVVPMEPMTGPRHFVTSSDNRFVYMLSELRGTVTTFALDAATGLLREVATASALPPDTTLRPGAPRGGSGATNASRDIEHDIWAADLHLTPDGTLLYVSERTSSTLGALRVDGATGRLTYLGSTATERQPRGFAIDPTGRYLVSTGQLSDHLAVHAIDASSGALSRVGRWPAGRGANWVEIVRFPERTTAKPSAESNGATMPLS